MPKLRPVTKTQAPAVVNKQLIVIPYAYALVLIVLTVWGLVKFEEYTAYISSFFGGPTTAGTIAVAVLLVGFAVFSMPFLLRLDLSRLARACSALFLLVTPVVWAVATTTPDVVSVITNLGLMAWGFLSFWILGGVKAFKAR